MGEISKYSNLYRNNTLERSVDDKGILRKYTLKEVQDLVDKLGTEKDENGRIKDHIYLCRCIMILSIVKKKKTL